MRIQTLSNNEAEKTHFRQPSRHGEKWNTKKMKELKLLCFSFGEQNSWPRSPWYISPKANSSYNPFEIKTRCSNETIQFLTNARPFKRAFESVRRKWFGNRVILANNNNKPHMKRIETHWFGRDCWRWYFKHNREIDVTELLAINWNH